jgi:hypothetical protein
MALNEQSLDIFIVHVWYMYLYLLLDSFGALNTCTSLLLINSCDKIMTV